MAIFEIVQFGGHFLNWAKKKITLALCDFLFSIVFDIAQFQKMSPFLTEKEKNQKMNQLIKIIFHSVLHTKKNLLVKKNNHKKSAFLFTHKTSAGNVYFRNFWRLFWKKCFPPSVFKS